MFDKLIVSEPEGADFKNRRSYFLVSSIVVGIFFTTAVVISIFAADIGLGHSSFELAEILAPVEMAAPEPETPQPQPRVQTQTENQLPTRQSIMSRTDEPTIVPTTISTTQNTQLQRPLTDYRVSLVDSGPVTGQTSGRNVDGPSSGGPGLVQPDPVAIVEKDVEPPPVIKKNPPPSKPVSRGVLNGQATSLPKPIYSAAARGVGAQGQVSVQVTIDESGRVISANAISGNLLLRPDAEKAARNARFTPTLLSDVPVKVTGVITYNFIR